MTDETFTVLHYAGPANWHHLIAPTRTFPLTEATMQASASAIDSTLGNLNEIEAIFALTDLASAACILSNAVANAIFPASAQDIFKDARTTAKLLDTRNKHTPNYKPTIGTYNAFLRAAKTNDPQVLALLLIDIIRIANHITKG